jgi:hypothetical protein
MLTAIAAAVLAVLMGLALTPGADSLRVSASGPVASFNLDKFSALSPIDSHAHVFKNNPAFGTFLRRLNLRILNICVVDKHDRGYEEAAPQHQTAREILHSTGGRAAWCSTFDPQDFEKPGFAEQSIRSSTTRSRKAPSR